MGRYRRRYYGGPRFGFIGGLAIALAHIAILLMLMMVMAFDLVAASLSALVHGGGVFYDEEVFQEYVEERYAAEFAGEPAEDNLLIVILTEPGCFDYHYMVKVGGHIDPKVADLFVAESSEFGSVLRDRLYKENYEKSMGSHLTKLMSIMEYKVGDVRDTRVLTCDEESSFIARFANDSELQISQKTVDRAVESFSSYSTVSTVLVVADMEDVFGKTFPPKVIVTLLILAALLAGAVILIVYTIRNKDRFQNEPVTEPTDEEKLEDHEKLDEDYWKERY